MVYLLLGIGLLLLVKGADILVDSASGIAKKFKIPVFIIGLFVVALGTSAPEAAIGIFSGLEGNNLITLGDVVGSSIVNITIVIAITAMVFPLIVDSNVTKREIPLSIFVQLGLGILLFTGLLLSKIESVVLIVGMLLFLGYIVRKSRMLTEKEILKEEFDKEITEFLEEEAVIVPEDLKGKSTKRLFLFFLIGLGGLVGGANLVVDSAVTIAEAIGMSQSFIGLTIVAFGTSLPELVTGLVAAFKKEADLAVGNIIGSNILNILFVLGISGLLHPIDVNKEIFFDLGFAVFSSLVLWMITLVFGKVSKSSGFFLLILYVVYLSIKLTYFI